ncbi:hypothetical protein [Actinoplanes sp. L3-i22]|uniref:hypothetical protein n=1 Tax=Actinoplanes sp. L3-i22 TaxID=2836373 RepID=UPI001C8425FD|nr:hypothetical protein [Actinoplanes sp. L3-i22]
MTADELVSIELDEDEREVLARGLTEWGGPARCTEALAVAMDFGSVEHLFEHVVRLRPLVRGGQPLGRRDWRRVLISAEIVFASDVFGSGWDWQSTTGFRDEETIRILRSLQRKIERAARIHELTPADLPSDAPDAAASGAPSPSSSSSDE